MQIIATASNPGVLMFESFVWEGRGIETNYEDGFIVSEIPVKLSLDRYLGFSIIDCSLRFSILEDFIN